MYDFMNGDAYDTLYGNVDNGTTVPAENDATFPLRFHPEVDGHELPQISPYTPTQTDGEGPLDAYGPTNFDNATPDYDNPLSGDEQADDR
jgi:hypothetical protein